MRSLSKTEQEIITEIVDHQPTTLEKLLGNVNREFLLKIIKAEKKVSLIRVNPLSGGTADIVEDFAVFWIKPLLFISTLVKLLYYLEQNGYIVSHLLTNEVDESYFVGKLRESNHFKVANQLKNTYDYDDVFLIHQLTKYSFRIIYPTEALNSYVTNGFKTPEDLRFNRTYNLAKMAIAVSLLIGIAGLCVSIFRQGQCVCLDDKEYLDLKCESDSTRYQSNSFCTTDDTLELQSIN